MYKKKGYFDKIIRPSILILVFLGSFCHSSECEVIKDNKILTHNVSVSQIEIAAKCKRLIRMYSQDFTLMQNAKGG